MKPEVARVIAGAEIIPVLPASIEPRCAIPDGIVGARILGFGSINRNEFRSHAPHIVNGGLFIDYLPQGSLRSRRVAIGFSDLGMWEEGQIDL
jgi:hypothetical protein